MVFNKRLPLYLAGLLLVLLVLWLEYYALPLAAIWLVARLHRESWQDRIPWVAVVAIALAIAMIWAHTFEEKVKWTFIFIFMTLIQAIFDRFFRKSNA